jgi:ferredoxin-type protein NapH
MYTPYRRASQIAVLVVMFLIPVLNRYEIYAITGTFYAINVGGLGIADPATILQAVFASAQLTVPLLSAALFPILLAILFGRIWCGWMCPYHVVSDAAAWLRSRFRTGVLKRTEPDRLPCPGSFRANTVRFGFLVLGSFVAGAIGIPVLNYINAPGVLSTEAMIFVKERSLSLEFAFIAGLFVLELILLPRFWCRLFCPTGAVVSVFRLPFTVRVANELKTPRVPCCEENRCTATCPMGLSAYREGDSLLCTNCGRCIDGCPNQRLRFKGF